MHFRMYRIGNFDLKTPVEMIEVAGPPSLDDGVRNGLQQAASECRVGEDSRHLKNRVLSASTGGILSTDRLIHLEEGEQCEAKRILHPWTPEAVELAPEDRKCIGHSLVAIPAQPDIQQVQSERTTLL